MNSKTPTLCNKKSGSRNKSSKRPFQMLKTPRNSNRFWESKGESETKHQPLCRRESRSAIKNTSRYAEEEKSDTQNASRYAEEEKSAIQNARRYAEEERNAIQNTGRYAENEEQKGRKNPNSVKKPKTPVAMHRSTLCKTWKRCGEKRIERIMSRRCSWFNDGQVVKSSCGASGPKHGSTQPHRQWQASPHQRLLVCGHPTWLV